MHVRTFCAGRAYNTFPLMDGKWIPYSDMFPLEPLWRNFMETTATVQVRHYPEDLRMYRTVISSSYFVLFYNKHIFILFWCCI